MKKFKRTFLLGLVMLTAVLSLFLVACNNGNRVKFSFNTQGAPKVDDIVSEKGVDVTLPTPEWEGHSFDGWYLDSDFSGSPVTQHNADQNRTFYAKWTKAWLVTLDVGEGSLTEKSFYLKPGENLLNALNKYVPTLDGFLFGAWYNGDKALTANDVMPEENITLKARYKVGYSVEIYEQNADATGYTLAETLHDYAYATAQAFTPNITREGFTRIEHEGEVVSKTLSETDPSSNVFKFYFNRTEVSVYLDPNGGTGNRYELRGLFGATVELSDDLFTREGYILVGWSSVPNGEILYPVDYIGSRLYGNTEAVQPASVTLTDQGTLYAVWAKGYSDIFRGGDHIYVVENNVYLERAGIFFAGEKIGAFYTFGINNKIILKCKLFDDGTFCYESEERYGTEFYLYTANSSDPVNALTTIRFDAYNGLTYSVRTSSSGPATTSTGTYTISDDGIYSVVFTEGNMVGRDFAFIIGYVEDDSGDEVGYVDVFQIRNDADYELGALPIFVYQAGDFYENSGITLTLSGFGTAVWATPEDSMSVYYERDEKNSDIIHIYSEDYEELTTVKQTTGPNGVKGVMTYFDSLDTALSGIDEYGTLTLDGLYKASYQVNGQTMSGGFEIIDSEVYMMIKFYPDGRDNFYNFCIGYSQQGQLCYQRFADNYGEYYYSVEMGAAYSPLLVIGEESENSFSVYGMTEDGVYAYIAGGNFSESQDTSKGAYLATVSDRGNYQGELVDCGFDILTLSQFGFSLDSIYTVNGEMLVSYWWFVKCNDTVTTFASEPYDCETPGYEEETLVLVNGFGIYTTVYDDVYIGNAISEEDGMYVLLYCEEDTFCFHIDEEQGTFIIVDNCEAAGMFYELAANGELNEYLYLVLDGESSAKLVTVTPSESEGEEPTRSVVKGTFSDTGEITEFGFEVYEFTAEEGKTTFKFILQAESIGTGIFARYNEEYAGEYTSANGDKLYLDGYSYYARYTSEGNSNNGYYYLTGDGEVTFLIQIGTMYETYIFDIKGENFTLRGVESGDYLIIDNHNLSGEIASLDGYGNADIYSLYSDENEPIGKGTYTVETDGSVTLNYTVGAETKLLVGELGIYTIAGNYYYSFIVLHKEVAAKYVYEKDLTVLELDALGNAVRYGTRGSVEEGTYAVITEKLLYFVNNTGTDASTYYYDKANGTISPVALTRTSYYSKDLKALVFDAYGAFVCDGVHEGYYDVVNGRLIVYRSEEFEGSTANKYGYYEVDMGSTTEDVKTYKNVQYYKSDDSVVTFVRAENEKDKYPLNRVFGGYGNIGDLMFMPSGSDEFAVAGTLFINVSGVDTPTSVQIVRAATDEEKNTFDTLIIIYTANGALYIEIELDEYKGNKSTYHITGMELYDGSMLPYSYLDYAAWIVEELGSIPENFYGTIYLFYEIEETGEIDALYIDGVFGERSGLTDINGNLITTVNHARCDEMYQVGDNSILYIATFTGEDGIQYTLQLQSLVHESWEMEGYVIVALTHDQEFTVGNKKIVSKQLVASELEGSVRGSLEGISIYEDGNEIETEYDEYYFIDSQTVGLIKYTKNEEGNRIIGGNVCVVKFTLKDERNILKGYESATVTDTEFETVFTADKLGYIGRAKDNPENILFIHIGHKVTSGGSTSTEYYSTGVTECKKNSENSYTVKTLDGNVTTSYSLTFTKDDDGNDVVTISEL